MAAIKQYVNLPSGTTNIFGDSRDLRVEPSSVPNVGPGDRIEWWIEPDPANTDVSYLASNKRARMLHPETVLSPSGAFENQILFPPVGGDKYRVKVAKKNQRANFQQTDEFETWRKLYYSVFYMGAAALNMFNNLEPDFKAAFAEGFIELENLQKTAALTEHARVDLSTRAGLGRPSFHFLGGAAAPGGVIDLGPTGTGSLINKPFHVAILVVPDIYRLEEIAKSFNIAAVVGSTVVDFRLHRNGTDPQSFLYTGTVTWGTNPAQNAKPSFSLVGAPTTYHSEYGWNLTAVAGLTTWLATAGHTARLDLSLVKETVVMGYSTSNLVVVRTVDGTTDVLETFTHEVGHGVQQTVKEEHKWHPTNGSPQGVEQNPKWHTDNFGGRGDHCSTNAVLRSTPPLPPGLTSVFVYGGAGLLCTMFFSGESHVDPTGKFCPTCVPRLKRVDLGSTTMTVRWNYFG